MVVALVVVLPAGCAASWVDEAGVRHVVGLVNLEIRPNEGLPLVAGSVVEIESLGLGIHSGEAGTSITVGYHAETTALLRNDVVVLGDPRAALIRNDTPTGADTLPAVAGDTAAEENLP